VTASRTETKSSNSATMIQVKSRDFVSAGPADGIGRPPFPPVRVTQISTSDSVGGAAIATRRLHHALGALGVRSQMLVARRGTRNPNVVEYNPFSPAPRIVGRLLFRLVRRWHRPSFLKAGAFLTPEWTLTGWRLLSQLPACDLVNLHWVADMVNFHTLPRLLARVPAVWTFHDMNAFTGGCHYNDACERFTANCGACPQLRCSAGEADMTRRVMQRKREIFRRLPTSRLTLVCPSSWLARETRRSSLCRQFDVRVIPNGVDVDQYHPVERAEARRRLNLPLDAHIVLFVAESLVDRRKGFGLLLKAFEALRNLEGLLLVTLGNSRRSGPLDPMWRDLGPIYDVERLRAAYSAADVFAIPSLQDNLPNTILESMACGTPVVAFATGGIAEAVSDGHTGLLAPTGDVSAYSLRLRRILEDGRLRHDLGVGARKRAEQDFTVELQARRYASLYQEILRAQAPAPSVHAPVLP